MSYHRSMLPLGALGWPMPEMASYGLTDSDSINPAAKLCGNAKAIQSALKDQGFYAGQVDGILGSGSVSAIKKFSLANNIGGKSWPDPVFCGKLREQQNLLLNREYEKRNPPPPDNPEQPGQQQPPGTLNQPPAAQPPAAPPAAAEEDNTLFIAAGVGVLLLAGVGIYFATRLRSMILELALGVGVGYLLTKGGYLSNGMGMTYCKRCLNPKEIGEPCWYCRRHPWFESNGMGLMPNRTRIRRKRKGPVVEPTQGGRIKSFRSRADASRSIKSFERSLGKYRGKTRYVYRGEGGKSVSWMGFVMDSVDKRGFNAQARRSRVKVRVKW